VFEPQPFGRYYLLSRLAMGGMAEVFIATDREPHWPIRLVAIKRILEHLAEQEEFLEMFLDEARIAATLHHDNILRVIDVGHVPEDDSFFLALPYVEGTEIGLLAEAARESGAPLSAREAAWAMARVCRALQYAHVRTDSEGRPLGIVHRDVSPPNILVSMDGEVLLTDFGIAKATQKLSITKAGVIKTKLGYTSPEVIQGIPADTRHDIFCTGLTLWELLTGRPPFFGPNEAAIAEAVRKADLQPPSKLRPEVPPTLDAIVMRALRTNRDQRFASAHDLADALDAWVRSMPGEAPQQLLAQRMKRLYGHEMKRRRERVDRLLEKAGVQEEVPLLDDEPRTDAGHPPGRARKDPLDGRDPPVQTGDITSPLDLPLDESGNGLTLPSRGEGLALVDPPSADDAARTTRTLTWVVLGLSLAVVGVGIGVGVKTFLDAKAPVVPPPTVPMSAPEEPPAPVWKPGPAWQAPPPPPPKTRTRRPSKAPAETEAPTPPSDDSAE
jgi:serine/threonine-protein kinase